MNSLANLSDDGASARFLMRWRGRQEGPYPVSVIEAKLAANEIGLLHEILYRDKWVTLRDYIAEREAVIRAELQAQAELAKLAEEEAERQVKEREAQQHVELLAEERRKNNILQASITERSFNEPSRQNQIIRKPHRSGTILALGIIGFFVCGPLCVAAWVMGDSDLREMDAGIMDISGRSTTSTGRTLGVLGTILWIVGVIFFFII